MSALHMMQGARLEFVCRKINGNVTKQKMVVKEHKKKGSDGKEKITHTFATKSVEEGDAYMVYLPTGHSYRLTADQVVKQGFDRQPNILNIERVNDTKTPAGRFKNAINMEEREKAWCELENEVIKLCTRRAGKAERSAEEVETKELVEA